MPTYPLLERIDSPADLRLLDKAQLRDLARELRAFLLQSVAQTGGHLSSNLGTVELTVALHYVFDTPEDRIVWDVGHQTYAHKVLTGRREAMAGLRQWGGPSGFPAPQRIRVRHVRHRAFVDVDLGRAGDVDRREAEGRAAACRGGDRRRRDERGHGVRGAQQRARLEPARDPQRQRDVDLGAGGRVQQLPRQDPVGAPVQHGAPRRQGSAGQAAHAGARPRQALGRAHEGHGASRHAVRGVRLQLHRPHRRPRPRDADAHARQRARAAGTAVPARDHAQGLRLSEGGGGSDPLPRRDQVRSGGGHRAQGAGQARLHAGVRRLAVRHGGARRAHRGHHAGDARRFGPRQVLAAVPRALLRRRHRRAARGDVRRRPRVRGHAPHRRDLFDVPAARVRPGDPRRRAAEPAGGVRDRPRGRGRRRRRHAHRRVRHLLPALPAQHDGDDAVRRERVPADAVHGGHAGFAGRRALSARRRGRACRSRR